jgi:hypothetical protein
MKTNATIRAALLTVLILVTTVLSAEQVFMTSLRITVIDEIGNVVENAQVTVYGNSGDYESGENPVAGPELTDEKGRVTFKDLDAKSYYIEAKKGDKSNYGGGEKTDVLAKNKLNKLNVVISGL